MHIDAGQLGKYELRERLGQGGMAEVWKAFDARLQRFVAIKFLHSMLRSDPTFISRFLREGQAVASLHHPNIVQIYDFETPEPGDKEALAYMVMDYIEGQTLAEFLRASTQAGKFLPPADLLSLFYSISDAIDYAHRRGLLHRDIKPANILLDQRNTARNSMGEPVLTDFGIVKMLGSATGTLTNSAMGTPLYISPEQALGHPDTAASDIYSLGVVLYEVCTGQAPFRGDTPFAILQQHIGAPPPPPEQFNPAISSELSAVILHSLAKEPSERYPSAMALMTSLAIALGLPLPARRDLPISSPDIRLLSDSSTQVEDAPTVVPGRRAPSTPLVPYSGTPAPAVASPASPMPDGFVMTPAEQLPTLVPARASATPAPAVTPPVEAIPTTYNQPASQPGLATSTQAPRSLRPGPGGQRRGWLIAISIALLVVLAGSGLALYQATRPRAGSVTTGNTIVGQAFFLSTGNGPGAQNQGINDRFQISLSGLSAPAAGKQYYAWLLPDKTQAEASARFVGSLQINSGSAILSYTDPQHSNLVGQFSRFLVTEEASSPVPISPALDQQTWRYYGEIPQSAATATCTGVAVTQLSVLCHLRHLLSGDPDLAKVNLQGGLNFWLQHNVGELAKWAQETVDHSSPVDVRHKLMNILYILDGPSCIQQDLQQAAAGADNVIDDHSLPTVAAIPLLDCAQTSTLPGFVTHIDNHLNAMLQSQGVSDNQKKLAHQINPELNTIASWLKQAQADALKLLGMSDVQLTRSDAVNLRSELDTLASQIQGGGTDATTGAQDPGVQAISAQIQQLAKLNVSLR
ncbi:MAG TPA: protein kinase [Ktedonobacteraceae bacterium]